MDRSRFSIANFYPIMRKIIHNAVIEDEIIILMVVVVTLTTIGEKNMVRGVKWLIIGCLRYMLKVQIINFFAI